MLKRNVTYEDFNGNTVTDTFYFNLSKAELVELEYNYTGGFAATIESIVQAEDNKTLINIFKDLILKAYGQKSEDGKRFIKSDQLREEFSQTAAYSELFMELAVDDKAASDFISGIVPKDMSASILEETAKVKTTVELAEEMRSIEE
jgi:hypothetical protein